MKKIKYRALFDKVNINENVTPYICYLKITENCNLNCYFCSQGKLKEKKQMSMSNYKSIINVLIKNNISEIIYTGGEPFLNNNLKEMIILGNKLKLKQSLVSNFMINQSKIKDVIEYIDSVGVSLYGIGDIHDSIVKVKGAFNKIISNLKYAKKNNPNLKININCTLIEENMDLNVLKDLSEFCQQNSFSINFARLNIIGLSEDIDPLMYSEKLNYLLKKLVEKQVEFNISNCIAPCILDNSIKYLSHGCGAGLTFFAVESNGDVKICSSSQNVIGNIITQNLNKILTKNLIKYKKFDWLPIYCSNCKYQNFCRGGCHAENDFSEHKIWQDKIVEKENNNILNENLNKKLLPVNNKYKKIRNNYILNASPVRILNLKALEILTNFNGEKNVYDILKKYSNDMEVREYIIALIKDGIIR